MDGWMDREEYYEKARARTLKGKASMGLVSKAATRTTQFKAAFQGLLIVRARLQLTARPLRLDDARESRLVLMILVQLQQYFAMNPMNQDQVKKVGCKGWDWAFIRRKSLGNYVYKRQPW